MRLAFVFVVLATTVGTAEAKTYGNARYNFTIDVPQLLSSDKDESDNGDGITTHSHDGSSELRAWGNFLTDYDFADEFRDRVVTAKQDGWNISLNEISGSAWAVFSGKKEGRIVYQRMISTCKGKGYANFSLEYPAAEKTKYDSVIRALSASLKAGKGRCS